MAQLTQQLSIFLENRPGTLARVCDELAKQKINIHALATSDTVDHAVVRLVVSDAQKALRIFEEHGTLCVLREVIMIEGQNRPGGLAAIARKLAEHRVNIEYAYCATPPSARKGLLILRVNDARRALRALNA